MSEPTNEREKSQAGLGYSEREGGRRSQKQKAVRQILLWQQIGCVVVALAEKLGISYKRALDIFYASDTCRRLHDERSGLYLYSHLYLADEVIMEQTKQQI